MKNYSIEEYNQYDKKVSKRNKRLLMIIAIIVVVIIAPIFWSNFIELPKRYNNAITLLKNNPNKALNEFITIKKDYPHYKKKEIVIYIKKAKAALRKRIEDKGQKLLSLAKQQYKEKHYIKSISLAKNAIKYFKQAQINYDNATLYVIKSRVKLKEINEDLFKAVKNRDIQEIKTLISMGVDINTKDKKVGNTALMYAVNRGYPKIVSLLISHGADVNTKNKNGKTPLMVATISGYPKIVSLLISHGADVNAKDKRKVTPLMYAVYLNNSKLVKLLLTHGADVNIETENGSTALDIAIYKHYKNIIYILEKHEAKSAKYGIVSIEAAFACKDKASFNAAEDCVINNDAYCLSNLIVSSKCVLLNKGENVVIMNINSWKGRMEIQRSNGSILYTSSGFISY